MRALTRAAAPAADFAARQVSAAIFGVLLLGLMVATHLGWPNGAAIARYDALFAAAVALQIGMLALRLETWEEARVILVFHLTGTLMEIFKTSETSWCGRGGASWTYPEESILRVAAVPLFTGFMYAAVGSYIARSWRIFDFRFAHHPPLWAVGALAVCAYVNFFTNRCFVDVRWVLFAAAIALFWRAKADVEIAPGRRLVLPVLAIFLGVAGLIWTAENIATWARVWVYPYQEDGWRVVKAFTFGSWFLLMLLSWSLVAALHRPDRAGAKAALNPAA